MASVVAEVVARYRADVTAYTGPVRQATDATRQFAAAMPAATQGSDGLKASSVALGAAVGGVAVMALTKATAAVKNFAMQGIRSAAQYEQTVISIQGIFQGMGMSAELATNQTMSYLGDLRDFAAETPFELPQVLDAVKRLLSIGYAAEEVKDTILPAVGDITAALGQPPQSIQAVVYAFGQMKSAGRVMSQDLMQIGNALPGFNAKVAIAEQLFSGDMAAMAKATEEGSLDSETAIQAIIKAMQEFPGAAGAMERQSKTLNGVMSTFSDTINNALIDGLYSTMPMLSGALLGVMPAVESLATAFGSALGPMLVQGAELMGALAPIVSSLAPPMIELVTSVSGLVSILQALAPLAAAAGQALGMVVAAVNMLPGPVKTAIALFIAFRVLMAKMPATWITFGASVKASLLGVGASLRTFEIQVKTAMISAKTQMGAMVAAARVAVVGVGGAFRSMAVAAKGFIMSLGPVGIALIAATVAFEIFSGKQAEAEERVRSLTEALSLQGPAADKAAAEVIAAGLAAQQWGGDFLWIEGNKQNFMDLADIAGISMSDIVAAVMQGGAAMDAVKGQFIAAGEAGLIDPLRAAEAANAINAQADAYVDAADKVAQATEVQEIAQEAVSNLTTETTVYNQQTLRAAQSAQALSDVQTAATDAVVKMQSAFDKLNRALSNEASYDSAIKSTKALKDALKENGKELKGNSDAALDNRDAIRTAAQDWIDYAQQTEDPIKQQKRLKEGQDAIRAALKEKGINPKDSDIFKMMKEQSTQSGKTVDEFAKQIPIANRYGIDVGKNFIDGILAELAARKDEVTTAAAEIGTAINSGAEAATEVGSPSKTAKRIAGYFIDGLVIGMTQGESAVYAKSGKVARRAVDGWRDTMNRLSGGLLTEWGRGLQDAVWAVKDAADQIADAQKSLNEARKDGSPREVAAAERELARAYRDQADAIAEAAEAQRSYDALRRLGSMKPVRGSSLSKFFTVDKSIVDSMEVAQAIVDGMDDAFDWARRQLIARARRAGMSVAAAETFADGVMEQFGRAIEAKQRHLQAAMERLAKVRERIAKLQEDAASRKEAGQDIASFIEERFGQPSEFAQAYDAASVGIDQAISLFDRFKKLIEQRYTGLDTGEDDMMVAYLEEQTQRLVTLIAKRDVIAGKLKTANEELDRLVKQRDDAETRLSDSMRNFFKPSGKIGSADEYIIGLQQRLAATKKYMADVDALRARGVSQAAIDQILEMGVENGGALAASLASASDAQLAEVASLTGQAEAMATTFGTTQADIMYGAGIAAQTALRDGLQAEYGTVITEINEVVAGIENAVSMLTDSNLVAGEAAAVALLTGLQSQEEQILAYIRGLAAEIRATLLAAINIGSNRGGKDDKGDKNDRGGKDGKDGRDRRRTGRSSYVAPVTPRTGSSSAGGQGVNVENGGVQVSVVVGEGQSTQQVEDAVRAAIEKALDKVAQQARNSRR